MKVFPVFCALTEPGFGSGSPGVFPFSGGRTAPKTRTGSKQQDLLTLKNRYVSEEMILHFRSDWTGSDQSVQTGPDRVSLICVFLSSCLIRFVLSFSLTGLDLLV